MIGNAPQLPAGLVFNFDALSPKCYSGSGTSFTEMISGATGTATTSNSGTVGLDSTLGSSHLKFANPNAAARTAYISFPVNITSANTSGVNVPQGPNASWNWWHYFQDAGSVDHPNFGWETGGSWDGDAGFVFGTGWGTDGPRWGIADAAYTVYNETGSTTGDYRTNEWQNYCVTFDGNVSNGVKTYLNGELVDERNVGTSNKLIPATNTNNLFLGATNTRGGNWNGYMDVVQMYETTLSASQVKALYNAFKGRF